MGLGEVDKARGVGCSRLLSRGEHGGDRELGWASNERAYEGWYVRRVFGPVTVVCVDFIYWTQNRTYLLPAPALPLPSATPLPLVDMWAWLKRMCVLSRLLTNSRRSRRRWTPSTEPMRWQAEYILFIFLCLWLLERCGRSRLQDVRATLARVNHNSRRATLYGSFVPIPGN